MLEINGYSIKEIADLVNNCGVEKAENIIENKEIISENIILDDIDKMLLLENLNNSQN